MYTWLLFDADGTLFDYVAAEHKALSTTFTQFGLDYGNTVLETYQTINSQLWLDFEAGLVTPDFIKTARFQRTFEALELANAPGAADFSAAYLNNLGQCTDLVDGALGLLDTVKQTHRLALITNGLTKVQRSRLSLSGLERYFEAVIISEEIGSSKPHPGIFEAAFSLMGNPRREEVLIIGDSLTSDMQGGVNYSIDTCWYNPENKPQPNTIQLTYNIQRLDDLLPIVQASKIG